MTSIFDKSKDLKLCEWESDTGLFVGVYSYNEGTPKLGLSRVRNGGWAKLGRLSVAEFDWLLSKGAEIQKHFDIYVNEYSAKPKQEKLKDDIPF